MNRKNKYKNIVIHNKDTHMETRNFEVNRMKIKVKTEFASVMDEKKM